MNNICHNLKHSVVLNLPRSCGNKNRTSMHFDFTYCLQPNIPVFVLNLNLPLYSVPVSPIYHSVPLYLSLVYFFPCAFTIDVFLNLILCLSRCHLYNLIPSPPFCRQTEFPFCYRCNQVMFDSTPKTPVAQDIFLI